MSCARCGPLTSPTTVTTYRYIPQMYAADLAFFFHFCAIVDKITLILVRCLNSGGRPVGLNYLFVDMNSYFASVEQHERPELRGRPVAVVPVKAETTCCIAASYEAKRFGVKTGTMVRDARQMCPELCVVEARPRRYVETHHRIVEAVESCLPVATVMSIDEMICKLLGGEREPGAAVTLDLLHRSDDCEFPLGVCRGLTMRASGASG